MFGPNLKLNPSLCRKIPSTPPVISVLQPELQVSAPTADYGVKVNVLTNAAARDGAHFIGGNLFLMRRCTKILFAHTSALKETIAYFIVYTVLVVITAFT